MHRLRIILLATALITAAATAPALAKQSAAPEARAPVDSIPVRGRAYPPNFAMVWTAYMTGASAYRDCVEKDKRAAIAAMWNRRAPIETAIDEISLAYRHCQGFEAFWQKIYFGGFDSPEHWIALELRAAKAAVLARAETSADATAAAATLLERAVRVTVDSGAGDPDSRAAARAALLGHHYVAATLTPDAPLDDETEALVEARAETFSAILPAKAVEELTAALALVGKRATPENLADALIRRR